MARWLVFVVAVLLPLSSLADIPQEDTLAAGAVVQQLVESGDAAAEDYHLSNGLDTMDTFSSLYFDVFEGSGLEVAVGVKDPGLKARVESMFGAVIGLAGQGAGKQQLAAAWSELRDVLENEVGPLFSNEKVGFGGLALQAFLILLREGFEAMLVIMALAAYLRRSSADSGMLALYTGIALALVASALTAFGMNILFQASGVAREALEGVTMLCASVVLLYVSHWLLAKRQAEKWQAYIRRKVDGALSGGQRWALGLAVFLAVYREGAETILFYYALAGQSGHPVVPMLLGSGAAAAVLLAAFLVMRAASLKLPLPVFFSVTAALLFYLAFNFAGTGILELQEAGWVGITPITGAPRLTWLGIYPTLETLLAQALVMVPLVLTAVWAWHRHRAMTTI
ncbi:FTR1 family iron permease [Marinobacter salinexigens]|uniref:FTR1 family iron permease n=1 Tax=Marinobacter salinexigens TaxID=2919747 RepID=A0A5B0VNL0_9GAMM|nr:FTR1 family protein [Marinobacter salinexigens]KAA1175958.1 FTR1 family iron permease [Marinobacter salinexigens]